MPFDSFTFKKSKQSKKCAEKANFSHRHRLGNSEQILGLYLPRAV